MAAASTAFRLCARAVARPRSAPALPRNRPLLHRTLANTPLKCRPADPDNEPGEKQEEYDFVESMLADVPAEDRTAEMEAQMRELGAELEEQEAQMHKSLDEETASLFKEPRPQRDSFWYDEEDDDQATHDIVGEEFDEDDIPTVAHGKLDEMREHRHYARIVAWEMPMLASTFPVPSGLGRARMLTRPELAKPFEPPKNDEVLRYRYTTYLGEFHPAQRKVVVSFSPSDLGLSGQQQMKLRKLAGPRYNPEKDEVKMSCESFDHQAQNKRSLSDQVEKLVEAAKVRLTLHPRPPPYQEC